MTLYLWRPKMLIARKTSCFYDCELWWIHIPQRSTMKDGQGVSIWVGGWFEVGVGVGVPRNMNVGLSGTHRRYVLYIWNDVKSGALIDRFWSVESLVQAMSADRVAMFGPVPMSLVKELDYRVLATRPSVPGPSVHLSKMSKHPDFCRSDCPSSFAACPGVIFDSPLRAALHIFPIHLRFINLCYFRSGPLKPPRTHNNNDVAGGTESSGKKKQTESKQTNKQKIWNNKTRVETSQVERMRIFIVFHQSTTCTNVYEFHCFKL